MKRLVFFFNWLYLFSLSLWVAGMFLLGILVEIMVRINLKDQPLVASNIMNKIMDVFLYPYHLRLHYDHGSG